MRNVGMPPKASIDNSNKKGIIAKEWLPVIIMIIVAILVRLYINSDKNHYLLAGSDGPYFPLQVKSLIENYRLGYADMPLVFILGAVVTKILLLFHIASETESILIAIKFIDAFLPPLAAIPVFYISKELIKQSNGINPLNYFLVAFSILSFTPLVIFSYQLQKNALAIIWIFYYIYFVIRVLKNGKRSDLYKAFTILLLCALTHFGSFGLLVFLSIIILFFSFWSDRNNAGMKLLKKVGLAGAVLVAISSLIAIFDFARFQKLIFAPFKIFEAPVLLFALNGQNFLLIGKTLFTLIMVNILAVLALIYFIQNRKSLERVNRVLGYSLVVFTLFISTPMLGLEWANRLFMMAYIPVTVMYLIIYNDKAPKYITISSAIIFGAMILHSISFAILTKPTISISDLSFSEFKEIGKKINFNSNDAIVGRQDLRLLGSWVYGTKGISEYLMTKEEYGKYNNIYIVRQILGKSSNIRGSEGRVYKNSEIVFRGVYFEVYQLKNNTDLSIEKEKIFKGVRGSIIEINGNWILVKDNKTGIAKTVFLSRDTRYNISNERNGLTIGLNVEVNGEWKPFSLAIDALTINEINQDIKEPSSN
jgi:hypothetical protein